MALPRGASPKVDELSWRDCNTRRKRQANKRLTQTSVLRDILAGRRTLYLLGACLLSSLHGIFIPLTSFLLGKIFDDFSKLHARSIKASDFICEVKSVIATMGGLAAITLFAAFFQSYFCYAFADEYTEHTRLKLFSRMIWMNMTWFDRLESAAATNTSNNLRHAKTIHDFLSGPFGFAIQGTAALLSSIGIAFYISWDLTLVILAGTPIAALNVLLCYFKIQRIEQRQETLRKQAGNIFRSSLKEVLTIKLLNGQKAEQDRYDEAVRAYGSKAILHSLFNASQISFLRLIGLGMFIQGLWYGGRLVRNGTLSPGNALTCFWACSTAIESIDMLNSQLDPIQRGLSSFKLLYEHLDQMTGNEVERSSSSPFHFTGDIMLRKISFSYPLRPCETVLDNVSMTFPEGQTTYIIGSSGSGKSTVGQLLAGLYRPTSGCITVGRTHMAVPSPNQIRQKVLYVAHDSALFSSTISMNILQGAEVPLEFHQAKVDIVSEAAGLYSQLLSSQGVFKRRIEGNCSLSGGQRQQVSIARALIRDAQILILDEVTSAIDYGLRPQIWQNIARLREGKTTIIITHDTEQITPDALVYELRDGCVLRYGSWRNLAAAELFGILSRPKEIEEDLLETRSFSSFDLAPLEFPGRTDNLPRGEFHDSVSQCSHSSRNILFQTLQHMKPLQLVIYILGLLSAVIHAACIPFFSFVFARLLSLISVQSSHTAELLHWIFIGLIIAFVDAISSFLMLFLLDASAQKWVSSAYTRTFSILIDQPLIWLQQNSEFVSEVTECLDRESSQLRNMVGRYTGYKLSALIMITTCVIWSLLLCWELTLLFLGIIPVMFGLLTAFESVSGKWEARVNRQADMVSSLFAEISVKIKTVKCLRLEKDFQLQYGSNQLRLRKLGLKRRIFTSVFFAMTSSMMIAFAALTIYFSAWLAFKGRREVSGIISALTILLFGLSNFNITISMVPQASGGLDTYDRMRRVAFYEKHGESQQVQGQSLSEASESLSLTCENIRYIYPSREEIVHKNLTLTIAAGKITVLSGPSGSGKSTIFHLFTKILEPVSGNLRIGSQDLSRLDYVSLRSKLICVSQEAPLFDGTISSNIAYPLTPSAPLFSESSTHFTIQQAAKVACIHDFIISLPSGYETHISATSMSTGQRARLALARALFRKPTVLLLDEVLSCLDWPTAFSILMNLRNSQKSVRETGEDDPNERMTVCIISHDERVWRFGDYLISLDA